MRHHPDAQVLAILRKHFAERQGRWILHANGPNRHLGQEILAPASIYVDLGDGAYGWRITLGYDDVCATSRGEGTDGLEGIEEGSLEELDTLLAAFCFNLGQTIEEMRRSFVAAVGREHVYVEPGEVSQ